MPRARGYSLDERFGYAFVLIMNPLTVELSEQESHTELQQVVFGRAGLYVIADFEAQTPMIVEPVIETSTVVDQVEGSIAEG